jgi:MFS family permease
VLTAGSVVGIVLRLVLGARADRVGGDQLVIVSRLMALGSLALLGYAIGGVPAHLLATPLAFGAGWAWPGLFNLSVVRRYPEAPGAATGMTQTGTYLGAGLGPLAFGALVDVVGWRPAWAGAAAAMALAAVAVGVGRRLADRLPVEPVAAG